MPTEGPPSSKTAPLLREPAKGGPAASASITLYHDEGAATVKLDPGSEVTVGRSPEADVVVADASLSRRHARFRVVDGDLSQCPNSSTAFCLAQSLAPSQVT